MKKRNINIFVSAIVATALISGCTMQRQIQSGGKATIITTDTTYIYHSGELTIKNKK